MTTVIVTAVVTAAAVLLLRVGRGWSFAARSALIAAAALTAIAGSTIAVAAQMYLSDHDLTVLVWVIGVSAVFSVLAAWLISRRALRSSVAQLVGTTRRIGDGDVVPVDPTAIGDFAALSTELAETSQRLAEARRRISELDAARRQFFAGISHDLRTPLSGIRALAEALSEGAAPDPIGYATTIKARADSLDRMVGDLFELSRLQTGTLTLHPEPVDLLDIVSDAVVDVRPTAGARGIVIEADGLQGHTLWADAAELTRAVTNLLTNSVRYAPADSAVLIRADRTLDERLVLSVIDQGEGVTAEDLGRMFEVGWRADEARTPVADGPAATGAGLGLAIVKGIVEAHGGEVLARHTPRGFELALTVPIGPPDSSPASR